jgi:AcrR family transcriptional regulator
VASRPLVLDRDEIVDAAVALLRDEGLDAVSMRRVAARLGVSPIPLYSRVGNKEALLDLITERLLGQAAPEPGPGMPWDDYAATWAHALRQRLREIPDTRLLMRTRRWALVESSRPLYWALRASGFGDGHAVRACRLLMWAAVGFVATETAVAGDGGGGGGGRGPVAGGDPSGVDQADADALGDLPGRTRPPAGEPAGRGLSCGQTRVRTS